MIACAASGADLLQGEAGSDVLEGGDGSGGKRRGRSAGRWNQCRSHSTASGPLAFL